MAFYEKLSNEFHAEKSNYRKWPKYSDAHFHDGYELYYLVNGSTKYLLGNEVFSICSDDLLLIPKNILHKTRPNESEKYERILFYISSSIIDQFIKEAPELGNLFSTPHIIRYFQNSLFKCKELLENVVNEYEKGDEKSFLLIKSYLGILFINASKFITESEPHDVLTDNNMPNKLRGIIDYINTNYYNDISLKTIADEFHFHPVYMSIAIKKYLGVTYSEYLNKIRIQKSLRILKNSKYNITEVATICGFNSSNHFCKTFKTYMNTTPMKFRKTLRKEEG